jgi:hypothetical protein
MPFTRGFDSNQPFVIVQTNILYRTVSQTFLLADPIWFRKITTDPHILDHVNKEYPDNLYQKFKIYNSELILDSHIYISAAYVTMHCII